MPPLSHRVADLVASISNLANADEDRFVSPELVAEDCDFVDLRLLASFLGALVEKPDPATDEDTGPNWVMRNAHHLAEADVRRLWDLKVARNPERWADITARVQRARDLTAQAYAADEETQARLLGDALRYLGDARAEVLATRA